LASAPAGPRPAPRTRSRSAARAAPDAEGPRVKRPPGGRANPVRALSSRHRGQHGGRAAHRRPRAADPAAAERAPPAPPGGPPRASTVGSACRFERVEHIYRMDTRKIVLEGPYVRHVRGGRRLRPAPRRRRGGADIGRLTWACASPARTDRRRCSSTGCAAGGRRGRGARAGAGARLRIITEMRALDSNYWRTRSRRPPPVDTALRFFLLNHA
jgi:hypothetical protein